MASGTRRTTGLRTYSKRDKVNKEAAPRKKRRVEDISTAESPVPVPENPSPARKIPRSSIKSYFKPRPRSTSPHPALSTSVSSDDLEPHEALTPPSSPPPIEASHISHLKQAQKRPRRRLTTRHNLPLEPNMSSRHFQDMIDDLRGIGSTGTSEKLVEQTGIMYSPFDDNERVDSSSISNQSLLSADCEKSDFISTETPGIQDDQNADKTADKEDDWPYSTHPPYEGWTSSTPPPLTKPPRELLPDKTWAPYPPDVDPDLPSAAIDIPPRPRRGATYTQTQLDLGLSNTIHCERCEMPYNPSLTQDTLAHRQWCKLRTMPELQKKELKYGIFVWKDIIDGVHHRIRVATTYSHPEQRAIAEVIIRRTYDDLPGLQYSSDDLWYQIQNPLDPKDPNQVPRFKLYTYSVDSKIVGVLLVERYTMDHELKARGLIAKDSSITGLPKHLVFDRLWVSGGARRRGFARRLADTARADFISGLHVKKFQVMMSEPTTDGKLWADRYFSS